MTTLDCLPAVIDPNIDPRLVALLRSTPPWLRVIFAGPDAPFLDDLQNIYNIPLSCPDVLLCSSGGQLLVLVSPNGHEDGLLLQLTPSEESFFVQPVVLCNPLKTRERGTKFRGHADRAISALENLVFRRVMRTGAIQ
jgi:hypothetical protein